MPRKLLLGTESYFQTKKFTVLEENPGAEYLFTTEVTLQPSTSVCHISPIIKILDKGKTQDVVYGIKVRIEHITNHKFFVVYFKS